MTKMLWVEEGAVRKITAKELALIQPPTTAGHDTTEAKPASPKDAQKDVVAKQPGRVPGTL